MFGSQSTSASWLSEEMNVLFFCYKSYLEVLCTTLYDVLQPFIIHINHLETPAEVCSILRLEMLEEHVQNHQHCPVPVGASYLTNIDQPRSWTRNSPADLHGMWYLTVQHTLVCLSCLYHCVDRPIFQGLSQEALTMCIQSVASAPQAISTKKSPIDGELREQIAPFQVDFTIKEMSLDFSKVKTAVFDLLYKCKELFSLGRNNALLEFLLEGTPTVWEQLVDSQKEVDKQLKASCEAFIHNITKSLAAPLLTFLDNGQVFVNMQTEVAGNVSLSQQPFTHADVIGQIMQEMQCLIRANYQPSSTSMPLYLAN